MALPRRLTPFFTNIHLWLAVAGLIITTWLHYTTSPLLFGLHAVYRYLYFLPVVYAALLFGLWGGLLTSVVASLLFAPHIWLKFGSFPQESLNDLLVALILIAVGILTGALADAERRQRQRQEATSAQLTRSLFELGQRTAALEEMQRYISSVLASLSCGVITLDTAGLITTDNRAAQQLLGDQMVGKPLPRGLIDPASLIPGSYFQIRLAGRPVGVRASELASAEGRPMGTVIVLDDLTEVKALEEQVRRAERLSALGTLAGGVAHEVRNPVGIIRASAQLMGSLPAVVADDESQEYLQVITQEADRVDRLVENLLNYARAGELNLGPIDLEDLLRSTAARLASLAEQAGVTITIDIEPGLPALEGDQEKLEQALLNLGLNALEAIEAADLPPAGGGKLSFAALRDDDGLSCIISDNGAGMAEEVQAHIFDPFFTTRDHGAGLGLAIVQRVITDHGGTVRVSSKPGLGTTFTACLPTTAP